jgi:hypothetical protein
MTLLLIILTIIFSCFSTAVMSYISMATPIGPWIAPTLVLLGSICLRVLCIKRNTMYSQSLALITAGGSVGGIIATAVGFSFPTLFFLDPETFAAWMHNPFFFCAVLTMLSLSAGGLGMLIANIFETTLLETEELPFPIGQLVYKMIAAQNQARKAFELVIGFLSTILFALLQGSFGLLPVYVPASLMVVGSHTYGKVVVPSIILRTDLLPMLLAIGFITGHVVALPLAAGMFSKMFIMEPLNALWFKNISNSDFVLAFCSGMVVVGALQSFFALPDLFKNILKKSEKSDHLQKKLQQIVQKINRVEAACIFSFIVPFLIYFKFSFPAQLFIVGTTVACTYQIVVIAGKIGLAQLGRFATFVMVPAFFLFGLDYVQVTITATFVELCGGVATDILFGRKMAKEAGISRIVIMRYQILGLLISSLFLGVVFWLLITRFGLGSEELFAQRAQARALLINARNFDIYILMLGALYGMVLKFLHINPMLVLGGLLMPVNYSLTLIAGGLLTFFVSSRQDWEPFWSGVFAANSFTELLKTLW